MDPQQLAQELQEAESALQRGAPAEAVDARVKERTGLSGIAMLRTHVTAGPEPTAGQRTLSAGGSAVGDFGALAGNAATFGLLDEFLGTVSPKAAEAVRGRVGAVRDENPLWATLPAEIAGGMLIPGAAAMNAARGGGLVRAAGAGAVAGGATGALTGFGEAEGSVEERLPEAALGGLFGAGAGAAVAPLARAGQAGLQMARGSQNARLGQGLAEIAGETEQPGLFGRIRNRAVGGPRTADIYTPDAVRQGIQNQIEETGQRLYAPFQSMPPSREIQDMIRTMADEPGIRSAVQDPALRYDLLNGPADFSNIRRIRGRLQALSRQENDPSGTFTNLFRRFDQEMQVAYPGVGEANRDFARASEVREAFDMGFRNSRREGQTRGEGIAGWNRPSEVRSALRTFEDNPAAQNAMRQGMRHRLLEDLFLTKDGTPEQIRIFMNADEGGEAMMRELFPADEVGDEQFTMFRDLIKDHAKPETIIQQLRTSAKWTAIAAMVGAGAAGGGAVGASLFR
ncbi:MAG: hypothetical protein AB7R40_23410 [Nitrospiraceae bacterium]